jgi:hypothetical protein
MNRLELAWSAWRALPRTERAQFLVLLREAYCREREAVVRENGGSAHGVRVSRLTDLTLREDDLRAAMTERSPGVRSWRLGSPLARFPGGPLLGPCRSRKRTCGAAPGGVGRSGRSGGWEKTRPSAAQHAAVLMLDDISGAFIELYGPTRRTKQLGRANMTS